VLDFTGLEVKYLEFKRKAAEFGFFPQGFRESLASVRGFTLERPKSRRYQEPGELCFVYEPPEKQRGMGNNYKAIICTTKRRIGFVGKDSGWVIIVNSAGEKVYSVGPFIRTSPDFFETLLKEARVARWRVFYRPICCDRFMNLVHGEALKSCYWRCELHPRSKKHHRRFDDLRKPFPPEVLEERIANRKRRRKKREKLRAEGKDPFVAFKARIRNSWVKRPLPQAEIQF
jgi:hypothetical protein